MTSSSETLEPSQLVSALSAERARYLDFVRRRVRTQEAAEDILQSALAKAYERAHTLTSNETMRAWFFRLLRNAIIDHQRREAAHGRRLDGLARETASVTPGRERSERPCTCIVELKNTLSPEHAEALTSIELEGIAVKDFAEVRGLTRSAAGVRVHRARKALRERVLHNCGACAAEGCLDCTCSHSGNGCEH